MKIFLFLLFPLGLQAQVYQLDSVRYSNNNSWNIYKYSYQDESNFSIRFEEYGPNGLRQIQDSYIEDSLLVYQLLVNLNDSLKIYLEYDELRRGIKWTSYKNDTLRQEIKYSYHTNTNHVSSESGIVLKNGDTTSYHVETWAYDDFLRVVHYLLHAYSASTLVYFNESNFNYINDSLSYSKHIWLNHQGYYDTIYNKQIVLPALAFGDTIRTWKKYYTIAADSSILSSDEQVSYRWGNFNDFADAGNWTYLHGLIYGEYVIYTPTTEGLNFTYYTSGTIPGNPYNWKTDIESFGYEAAYGSVKFNDAQLPVERIIEYVGGGDGKTEWFYSTLNKVADRPYPPPIPASCKIVSALDENTVYFDLMGRQILQSSATQFLIEIKEHVASRIFFINE